MKVPFKALFKENVRFIKKSVWKPYGKMLCMRLILFYQKHLSKHTCMYRPTCSQYAVEAITKYGAAKGGWLALKRFLRCHPFTKRDTFDPVP